MFTFEVGKTYFTTSACDSNCIFKVEIVKRTAKTVTFRRDGKERPGGSHFRLYPPGRPARRAPRPGHGWPARNWELWRHVSPGGRRDRRFPGERGNPLDPRRHHGGDPLGGRPHLSGGAGRYSPRRVALPLWQPPGRVLCPINQYRPGRAATSRQKGVHREKAIL